MPEKDQAAIRACAGENLFRLEIHQLAQQPVASGKATEGGTIVGREKLIRHDHSQDPVLPEQGRAVLQEWNIEIEFAGCRFELLFEVSDERIVQILNANVRGIADDAVEAVTRGRFPVRKNAGEFEVPVEIRCIHRG